MNKEISLEKKKEIASHHINNAHEELRCALEMILLLEPNKFNLYHMILMIDKEVLKLNQCVKQLEAD